MTVVLLQQAKSLSRLYSDERLLSCYLWMIKALLANDSFVEIVIEEVAEHQIQIPLDRFAFTSSAEQFLSDNWQVFLYNTCRGGCQLMLRELPALCKAEWFFAVIKGVNYRRLHFVRQRAHDKKDILRYEAASEISFRHPGLNSLLSRGILHPINKLYLLHSPAVLLDSSSTVQEICI